jgi:3-oxoacyl-[acyl-carrier-protein] synthase-3
VAGLGVALPKRAISNDDVASLIGVDAEWIVRRTGVHERRRAAASTKLVELASGAAHAALEDSGLAAEEIDLVIVATITNDAITPNAAPQVAHDLGAVHAGAFDLGSACTGFVTALSIGSAWIESGRAESVLVVGADILSRHIDHRDKRTAALFGDGAGAVVLSGGALGELTEVVLGSDGSCARLIETLPTTGKITMDGHETFKHAVTRLAAVSNATCKAAGVELADIDAFVFHQANGRIIAALVEQLDLPKDRVVDCIAKLGNTSAASVPLALDHARSEGLLYPGARVLLAAFGAGFTWAGAVLEWGTA